MRVSNQRSYLAKGVLKAALFSFGRKVKNQPAFTAIRPQLNGGQEDFSSIAGCGPVVWLDSAQEIPASTSASGAILKASAKRNFKSRDPIHTLMAY